MNTFWLKIALVVAVIIGVVILVNAFMEQVEEDTQVEKTFNDVIEEDDKRLRAEPEPVEPPKQEEPVVAEEAKVVEKPAEPVEKVEPAKPVFKELAEHERIDAEKHLEWAIQNRKIGRLPGPAYKPMVDSCRYLIQKYPDSVYAFKAKRMLADIPERFRSRYKITDEEIDLGDFK